MKAYWRMLRRDKVALASAGFLLFVIVVALIVAPIVADGSLRQNLRLRLHAPLSDFSLAGLFGTDLLGRSMLMRMIAASQISVGIALSSAVLAALIGTAIGIFAGYRGGFIDAVAMRLADVVLSFPMLLLAILFLYLLAPQASNVVILLVIGRLPLYVRVTRAETREIRSRLFVDAARTLGASGWSICVKEIAPVVLPTVFTLVALDIGFLMLLESALSFLGLGVQPPNISWGGMVAEGRRWIDSAWWLTVFPGAAIFLTALSANLFSNWLRMAMDPVQRWRLEATPETANDEALQ
ncbi:MAG TPA: ABC transporter permease [Devosiaceae bacterium]|jgi:peptide/nickel transport system permease protein